MTSVQAHDEQLRHARRLAPILLAAAALVGCGDASGDGGMTGGQNIVGNTAGTTAGTIGTAGVNGAAGFAGTIGGAGDSGGTAGTGTTTTAGRATMGSTAVPCDVAKILQTSCQSCHAATPLAGVPMALMSWEDTQLPSVSSPGTTVHQMMKMRIHDTVLPMPPATAMTAGGLSADKLAVLDAWLDAGAPAGTDPSCAPKNYGGVMPPDVENCYEVRAHQPGTKDTPLTVTGGSENYASFYFDAPWPDGAQGVFFETLPGEHPEILHHWLIYAEENGNEVDGTAVYPAPGSHPTAPTLIAGWAPGSNNNDIPSNVGLQLHGPNRKMSMEIHFYNPTGPTVQTTAGVKICTVEKFPREHTATISWLGTELGINIPPMAVNNTATGVCTPQYTAGDITVLRSWPHMHLMGTHMEATILRKDGSREPISPPGGWPFDFNNEISHSTPYVVHPGDKVETVCHYTNTEARAIQVGFENRYEMCFNFTIAYPAKALVNKGLIGSTSLTNSSTACLY